MSKKIPKIENKKQKTQSVSTIKRARTNKLVTDFPSNTTFLYRFVYHSRISLMVAFMLLLSFALPGIDTAQAAVDGESSEVNDVVVADLHESIIEDEEVSEPEVAESVIELTESTVAEASIEEGVMDVTELEETLNPEAQNTPSTEPDTTEIENDETGVSEVGDDELLPEDENTTEGDEGSGDNNQSGADDTNVETTIDENEDLTNEVEDSNVLATTSEEVVEVMENTTDVVSVVSSDSEFSFTKDQCTQLATGSFYCLEPQGNTLADALFAAQDAEGDMEIYFVRNNEQVQITDNDVDDAAPYYDQNSDTIVWHRLIEDRFQIISYDIEEGLESQLTRTAENNMEPTRQGEYTVWQRWIDGGWNIILHDGVREQQLTKTTSHNVAPYIHGTLVVWNRHNQSSEKTIEMYDITTDAYVTIDDPEGLSVSNPRMVFVYDSLHPNGDIVTKGYDVLARKFIELDTLPRQLPDEIPTSDSTGETRALIQSKPSPKSEIEDISAGTTGSTTPQLPPPIDATSTLSLTLDLSASSSVPMVTPEELTEPQVFDLVIPPLEISTTSEASAVQE